jgi:predicted Zn-dependent peptidase
MDAIRSVTSEEIRTMAQKYLRKETLIDVVAGKKV